MLKPTCSKYSGVTRPLIDLQQTFPPKDNPSFKNSWIRPCDEDSDTPAYAYTYAFVAVAKMGFNDWCSLFV